MRSEVSFGDCVIDRSKLTGPAKGMSLRNVRLFFPPALYLYIHLNLSMFILIKNPHFLHLLQLQSVVQYYSHILYSATACCKISNMFSQICHFQDNTESQQAAAPFFCLFFLHMHHLFLTEQSQCQIQLAAFPPSELFPKSPGFTFIPESHSARMVKLLFVKCRRIN